eukprot:3615738-Rhodomonas_salina.1
MRDVQGNVSAWREEARQRREAEAEGGRGENRSAPEGEEEAGGESEVGKLMEGVRKMLGALHKLLDAKAEDDPRAAQPAPQPEPTPPQVQDGCSAEGGLRVDGSDKCFFVPRDGASAAAVATWEGAEGACQLQGAHLASVASERDNDAVYALFVKSGARASHGAIWIGVTDEPALDPTARGRDAGSGRGASQGEGGAGRGVARAARGREEPPVVKRTCAELSGEQEDLSDKCFFVPAEAEGSWEHAENVCMTYGGHLASVNSEEENALVHKLLAASQAKGMWIGISDDSHLLEYAHKNKWVWSDGTDVLFSSWPSGEPKDASSGHKCAMVRSSDEAWTTQVCSVVLPFVCALDTHALPKPPKLDLGAPLGFPPSTRELVLADAEGRAIKYDRDANVMRLVGGEAVTFGVLAPPRADSRHEYVGTESVALRVLGEDLYLRHQGFVTHLSPWQGYVADTRAVNLAPDYAWKFEGGEDGTWTVANDYGYGGWVLGYDEKRDVVLIVDSEADAESVVRFTARPPDPLPEPTPVSVEHVWRWSDGSEAGGFSRWAAGKPD